MPWSHAAQSQMGWHAQLVKQTCFVAHALAPGSKVKGLPHCQLRLVQIVLIHIGSHMGRLELVKAFAIVCDAASHLCRQGQHLAVMPSPTLHAAGHTLQGIHDVSYIGCSHISQCGALSAPKKGYAWVSSQMLFVVLPEWKGNCGHNTPGC